MSDCIHGNPDKYAPDEVIRNLPICQGTDARHKCPVCAYNEGVAVGKGEKTFTGTASECKHDKSAPQDMIDALPIYQGGDGRHGCVHTAYQAGIKAGKSS